MQVLMQNIFPGFGEGFDLARLLVKSGQHLRGPSIQVRQIDARTHEIRELLSLQSRRRSFLYGRIRHEDFAVGCFIRRQAR
jgi:hypothetical protein